MKLSFAQLAALAAFACSANPLDPGKKGDIRIAGLGTCNIDGQDTARCEAACRTLDRCVGLSELDIGDTVGACVTACETCGSALADDEITCASGTEDCAEAAQCVGREVANDLCPIACENLARCVDLSQTPLQNVAGCVTECRSDQTGLPECLVNAGVNCDSVAACLQ